MNFPKPNLYCYTVMEIRGCKEINNIAFTEKEKHWPGAAAIRTKVPSSHPKWEVTEITNIHNTKRTYGKPHEQHFPKVA